METMFFTDEIRAAEEINIEKIEERTTISKAERDIAIQLIENLTARFEPEKYHDEYRKELMALIRMKVEGDEIVEQTPVDIAHSTVIDLMERLKRSV